MDRPTNSSIQFDSLDRRKSIERAVMHHKRWEEWSSTGKISVRNSTKRTWKSIECKSKIIRCQALKGWMTKEFTPLSTFREFFPVATFMTPGSVGAPIRLMDKRGMMMQVSQRIWPAVKMGGRKRKAAPSWTVEREAIEAAHNWRTLRRQNPTWRASRTRWSKEDSSSRWKDNAQGSELSRRLNSAGDTVFVCDKEEKTGTCWQTWGYNGSTAKL